MKFLSKILIAIFLFIPFLGINGTNATENIKGLNSINNINTKSENLQTKTKELGYEIINTIRWIFSGILVIFIVYAGIQMITSMGTDDDSLSKAKRSLWYAIIGLIFVNFPVKIYEAITEEGKGGDYFIVTKNFNILLQNILTALEILLGAIAVFVLVLEGIKLIANSKDSESFTKSKQRIQWVLIGLIFLGFIQLWIMFLQNGNVEEGSKNIFKPVANLFLYLAGPIALFFLSLAGYYMIFSNGDEEKAKKGKNIIINTCIGVIIMLCIYVLLNDISLLNF